MYIELEKKLKSQSVIRQHKGLNIKAGVVFFLKETVRGSVQGDGRSVAKREFNSLCRMRPALARDKTIAWIKIGYDLPLLLRRQTASKGF